MTNKPFKPGDIEGIVKNAKRKSIKRNIIITTLLIIILGFIAIIGNGVIVSWAFNKASEGNELLYEISEPNVVIGQAKLSSGILSGEYIYQKYKLIEDKVVPWGTEQKAFNALGKNTPSAKYDSVSSGETKQGIRYYNPTNGQRMMLFYHPWLEYKTIQNDLSLIEKAPSDAVMEVAISFDRPFSVNEIQKFLNLRKKITWYWVNDYYKNDKKNLQGLHETGDSASLVYGFNATAAGGDGDTLGQNEDDYIAILTKLKGLGSYDYIVDRLLETEKENRNDGLILGVVVTGTKDELLKLKEDKHIRAISLGAVATDF
ncbi:anti sigma factor C-terminal domain-containing protein [Bacillus sp. V5-8f]|uniref:anti sigma factor C-terminal domain-containing protein n=1 Tax=Bacillus sp. V5-8f TaxID=2053044 RepID=UPI000C782677|nr:anti sigma factor C-terminal domain-containing protein [Bacillus sp. V5-8f]PLT33515.1 hypothetical protein CUU64_13155 [Bacillus sp. V5-8f]